MAGIIRDDEGGVFATSACSEYLRFIQSTRKIPRNATHPTVLRKVFSKSSQSAGRRALQTNGACEVQQLTVQRHRNRVLMVSSSVPWVMISRVRRTGQTDHVHDENGDPHCVTQPAPLRNEETKNDIGANHQCKSRVHLLSHKIQQVDLLCPLFMSDAKRTSTGSDTITPREISAASKPRCMLACVATTGGAWMQRCYRRERKPSSVYVIPQVLPHNLYERQHQSADNVLEKARADRHANAVTRIPQRTLTAEMSKASVSFAPVRKALRPRWSRRATCTSPGDHCCLWRRTRRLMCPRHVDRTRQEREATMPQDVWPWNTTNC